MKRKHIILILIGLIALVMIPFFMMVATAIKRFKDLGNIEMIEPPYKLSDSVIVGLNLKSGAYDTIAFKEIHVVNFWASWCKPCIEEIPSLQRLNVYAPNAHVVLLSFDSVSRLNAALQKYKWDLPAYQIDDTLVFNKPTLLPVTFILKHDTIIKAVYGAEEWDRDEVKRFIDSVYTSMNLTVSGLPDKP